MNTRLHFGHVFRYSDGIPRLSTVRSCTLLLLHNVPLFSFMLRTQPSLLPRQLPVLVKSAPSHSADRHPHHYHHHLLLALLLLSSTLDRTENRLGYERIQGTGVLPWACRMPTVAAEAPCSVGKRTRGDGIDRAAAGESFAESFPPDFVPDWRATATGMERENVECGEDSTR